MATEREARGVPAWVWWIVGGLVALILLWMLLGNAFTGDQTTPSGGAPAVGQQPGEGIAQPPGQPAAGLPINPQAGQQAGTTDTLPYGQPDRLRGMVGQSVQLNTVPVQNVVDDKFLWVGPSNAEQIFAAMVETSMPGQPMVGLTDVNPGDSMNISGEIRMLPSAEEMRSQWMLDQSTIDALRNQEVYLHVRQASKSGGG